MKSILLIDHGSRRSEANEMLDCMANMLQAMAGSHALVRHAHMELAEPSIERGFRACVESGATEVIVFPYMLSPGRHVTSDIPRMVSEVADGFPQVAWRMTDAFGMHEQLAAVILERAGVEPERRLSSAEACRCWHSSGDGRSCGVACRERSAECEPGDAVAAGAGN